MVPRHLLSLHRSTIIHRNIHKNHSKCCTYHTLSKLQDKPSSQTKPLSKPKSSSNPIGHQTIHKTYHDLIKDQVNLYPHKDFVDTPKIGVVSFEKALEHSKAIASGLYEMIGRNDSVTYSSSSPLTSEAIFGQLGAPLAGKIFGSFDDSLRGEDFIKAINATRAGILLYSIKGSEERVEHFYELFDYLKKRAFLDGRQINDYRIPTLIHFIQDSMEEYPGLVYHLSMLNYDVDERDFRGQVKSEDFSSIFLTPEFETIGLSQYNIINTGNAVGEVLGITPEDIVLNTLRPYRAVGQSLGIGMNLSRRSKMIIANDHIHPKSIMDKLSSSKATVMLATQNDWNRILNTTMKSSHLRDAVVTLNTHEYVDSNILQKIKETTGAKNIYTVRGNDETSGVISVNDKVLPGIEVDVVDEQGKTVVQKNKNGNINLKGYNVMKGYWNNESLTNQKKGMDGWLKTGLKGSVSEDGTISIEN